MDAKERWTVVKFLIAATGLKREDARCMLDEMPQEKWSKLWLDAQMWDRDAENLASQKLKGLLGDEQLHTLVETVRRATKPETRQQELGPAKRAKKR